MQCHNLLGSAKACGGFGFRFKVISAVILWGLDGVHVSAFPIECPFAVEQCVSLQFIDTREVPGFALHRLQDLRLYLSSTFSEAQEHSNQFCKTTDVD